MGRGSAPDLRRGRNEWRRSRRPSGGGVRLNLIVTEAPFSAAMLDAHVDTSSGRIDIGTGHVEGPDVTVSLDYDTARSLFVQGDVQAVLQAFLGGRIKVDGDLSKLLNPQSGIWPGPAPARLPALVRMTRLRARRASRGSPSPAKRLCGWRPGCRR